MNTLCKKQLVGAEKGDVLACTVFMSQILGMAA